MQTFISYRKYELDFLPMRVWIGLWTFLYLFLFVAFNLASLVRYITRFTEEIFATVVSSYFIYKALKSVSEYAYPYINFHYVWVHNLYYVIQKRRKKLENALIPHIKTNSVYSICQFTISQMYLKFKLKYCKCIKLYTWVCDHLFKLPHFVGGLLFQLNLMSLW